MKTHTPKCKRCRRTIKVMDKQAYKKFGYCWRCTCEIMKKVQAYVMWHIPL
ncbi:MAG: hypothetical protein WC781_03345 [Candidatus Pacearchaeota archaeon]